MRKGSQHHMPVGQVSTRLTGQRITPVSRRLGTWKLAYADFLTALCAFFLIMWIIHGVSADDKAALAEQFGAESSVSGPHETALQTVFLALQTSAELSPYRDSVRITREAASIRLELTDVTSRPLFDIGHGQLNSTGAALVQATGRTLGMFPVEVRIEGHTDATPIAATTFSNWELSSDRAHAARRLLIDSGLPEQRIKEVSGLAHTRPLEANKADLPANRRISIVLSLAAEPAGV